MTTETRNEEPFGAETSKGRMNGGLFTLFAGLVLLVIAFALFIVSFTQGTPQKTFGWRKAAIPIGAFAVGLVLFGWTLSLPSKKVMRVLAGVGLLLCAVATVLLLVHYPNNINVAQQLGPNDRYQADYVVLDSTIYFVGFAFLVSSLLTSIVGYFTGRGVTVVTEEGELVEDDEYGPGYEVPDWVVERDIEYAMKKYGVEWGEGPITGGDKSIHVAVRDSLGPGVKIGGLGKARVVQLDGGQVDEATGKLSGVRPQKRGAIPGQWADESVAALKALRAAKAQNPVAYTPKSQLGFWARVKAFFTGKGKSSSGTSSSGPANGASAPVAKKGKTIVIPDEK